MPRPVRTLNAALPAHAGGPVRLEGWVHRRRAFADRTFLVLRDRSGLSQTVVTDAAARRQLSALPEETVVRVEGTATANSRAPGGVEVTAPVITALSPPAVPSPLELWRPELDASLPTLLDHGALSWRHPAQNAVWQVAASSLRGFRRTLDAAGFTEIATPKVTATATESGAGVFAVDWFGRPAFLAQSPQFSKQALVGAFERVYETGPVFRAEPHDTVRHLAQYTSLDVELGFIEDHRDVLAVLREVLAGMVEAVGERAGTGPVGLDLPVVPEEVPVVHFSEALRLVGASPDEPDLAPEHERALSRWAVQEHGSEFLAVEGYPSAKRPFYTHPQPDDPRWTNSFDLLFRGLELVTGGQRLHDHAAYVRALTERGMDPEDYHGYLDTFSHGMPPHGGFALGIERWVARLTGLDNIRRSTLFPRDLHRLTP